MADRIFARQWQNFLLLYSIDSHITEYLSSQSLQSDSTVQNDWPDPRKTATSGRIEVRNGECP